MPLFFGILKTYKKPQPAFLLVLTAAILAAGLFLYAKQVNRMLAVTTHSTMHEIADHDTAFVENTLDRSWENLGYTGKRIQLGRYTSLKDVQISLNRAQTAGTYTNLYLVDSTGKLYSGAFLIKDGRSYAYVKTLFAGTRKSVMRCNEYDYRVDDQHDSLMYSVLLDPFTVEGIRFIGIVGQTDISEVRSHMNLVCFDGNGMSSVVSSEGTFIVNETDLRGIGYEKNLFEYLSGAHFYDGYNSNTLKEDMRNGRVISCTYRLDNKAYSLYMTRMTDIDWYLTVTVSTSVFTKLSAQFVLLTGIMLVLVLFFIFAVLFAALRVWQSSVKANANAAAESEFLSRMSHEIRTPLNALIGLNYLMLKSLDDRTKIEEYLVKSESTSQYLLSLINDILDISKLKQSRIVLRHDVFSLEEMAFSVETMMRSRMEEKNIDFSVSKVLVKPYIFGDELRLKQVLLNILSNASKFTRRNGKVDMLLFQKPELSGHISTVITVSDTGIGMSKEFQKHIFESFTQENSTENCDITDNSLHGTGLGMAISYLLMKEMNGSLSVESTAGKGSTFKVVFTADTATEIQMLAKQKEVEKNKAGTGNKLHILIAEDNQLNAEILMNILEKEGYTTSLAENGQQAVDMFCSGDENRFDVILMDSQMPVMDGFTAAARIRSLQRKDAGTVKIYACTANTSDEDREKAKQSKMDGFIAKPINIEELRKILGDI